MLEIELITIDDEPHNNERNEYQSALRSIQRYLKRSRL